MHPNVVSAGAASSTFVGIDKLLDARKRPSKEQKKAEVLAATTAWIVEDNQPLNATSKPAFRRMVETIDKSCPLITRDNVRDDIGYLGFVARKAVQRELDGKHFSLTTDLQQFL
jgi:hypothetical protein